MAICLTPANIGGMRLKNRVLFPSMCHFYCDETGSVTPQLEAYVRARAEGGAAAIIMPGSPYGKPGPARPALSDDRYADGWKRLLNICRANDCRLIVQIHPTKAQIGRGGGQRMPEDMTQAEIDEIVAGYAACAKRARAFGLDGAEIHGAHAHEVAQFLSPLYNHRTDAYGGSVEGRSRLAVEVIRAIKREAGADFPLIFRISALEMVPGGRELDETVEIVRLLEAAGADALHVSVGMPASEAYISAPMDVPDAFNAENAAAVRRAVHVPVIAVNRINTPELAEQVVASGQADFVAIGRGLLADPQFVRKMETGEPIRLCLGCNQGCRKSPSKKAIFCAQNPFTGREAAWALRPTLEGKRVLVAGAGVAGLEAAMDLAKLGAQVEVWEAQPHAGGLIKLAKLPPHKAAMARMADYRLAELKRLHVPVRLNHAANAANVASFAPDLLVAATGSRPALPPIEGLADAHALSADEALLRLACGEGMPGARYAVLGGGLAGLETADALCAAGAQVDVFEQVQDVGAALPKSRRLFLMERLARGHCVLHAGARITSVRSGQINYMQENVLRSKGPFDAVIVALGRHSDHAWLDELRALKPELPVVVLGDAQRVGTAMDAVAQAAEFAVTWTGEDAGVLLESPAKG